MSPFETILRNIDSLSLKELTDLQGFIGERIAELSPVKKAYNMPMPEVNREITFISVSEEKSPVTDDRFSHLKGARKIIVGAIKDE